MEKIKNLMSRWVFTLLAAVLVLTGLVGCSSQDVETALDVAIGVLEVAEALETESEIENDVTPSVTELSSESQSPTEEIETEIETEADKEEPAIDEDGHYTSKEEVALYIHTYGKLPSNFISKNEAEELGWKKKQGEAGQLHVVAPGMSIGGSRFGNYEGLLPEAKGRKYYECDINYVKGNRGAERIVYSNDGLIFYTGDHYESFEQLYPVE